MNTVIPIKTPTQIVRERLEAEGFSGLYVGGECACTCSDLAPCGSAEPDEDGYINGCEPGHVISDPSRRTSDWMVSGRVKSMSQAEFDETIRRYR